MRNECTIEWMNGRKSERLFGVMKGANKTHNRRVKGFWQSAAINLDNHNSDVLRDDLFVLPHMESYEIIPGKLLIIVHRDLVNE